MNIPVPEPMDDMRARLAALKTQQEALEQQIAQQGEALRMTEGAAHLQRRRGAGVPQPVRDGKAPDTDNMRRVTQKLLRPKGKSRDEKPPLVFSNTTLRTMERTGKQMLSRIDWMKRPMLATLGLLLERKKPLMTVEALMAETQFSELTVHDAVTHLRHLYETTPYQLMERDGHVQVLEREEEGVKTVGPETLQSVASFIAEVRKNEGYKSPLTLTAAPIRASLVAVLGELLKVKAGTQEALTTGRIADLMNLEEREADRMASRVSMLDWHTLDYRRKEGKVRRKND